MTTVVNYVLDKLSQMGVGHVFGVPGDYAFPINDGVVCRNDMKWVGCSNELNAAYAADGYARIRGLGVVSTTYGVGELSALNGVAGAYAEHVMVVHIVGMPKRSVMESGALVHHMLGNGDTESFYKAAGHIACDRTILSAQNCIAEIDRVFTTMHKERRPIYIGIPADVAHETIVQTSPENKQASELKKDIAQVVAERIITTISNSKTACVLPGMLTARFGCRDAVRVFLERSGLPYATTFMDKSVVGEDLPGYLGMYFGQILQKRVANFIETADCVLSLGVEKSDFTTGLFTSSLQEKNMIRVSPEGVYFGTEPLLEVSLEDVMAALAEQAATFSYETASGYLGDDEHIGCTSVDSDVIHTYSLYESLQQIFRPGDIIVAETGTISMGMGFVRVPEDVHFEVQSLWGSIGWATPAAFGMAMAAPERRVILLTGEGSHQLTVQAMGDFARFGCKPLVVVLNNEGYLIERIICDDGERYYNDIAEWDYTMLARAFGCRDWYCHRVSTPYALQKALKVVTEQPEKGAYLEVIAPRYDMPPMAQALGIK